MRISGRNTPEEGGSTVFPSASGSAASSGDRWRTDSGGRLEVFPRRGTAVLWDNTQGDGKTLDRASLHSGQPVIEGCKWVMTIWFFGKLSEDTKGVALSI